jgi:hypothetical protein
VSHGTLTANKREWTSTTTYTIVPVTGASIVVNDTVAWVNNALSSLVYTPTEKYVGSDTLHITAIDQAQPVPGYDAEAVPITVTNVAPSIAAPASVSVNGYSPTLINGISISDPDIGSTSMTVSLSVSHGVLNLPASTSITGNDSSALSITDTLNTINRLLGSLRYTAASGYAGSDSLLITASDQSVPTAGTASEIVPIVVSEPALAPPVITVPGPQTVAENSTVLIPGVSVSDADAGATGKLIVTLSVGHGSVTVQVPSSTNPTAEPKTYTGPLVSFTETLTSINTALAGLQYAPTAKYDGTDTLSITAVDQSQPTPGSDTKTVAITVSNTSPTITAPSTVVFTGSGAQPVNGVSVSDPDIDGTNMTVTLLVSRGVLSVPTSSSVTGNNTASVIITDNIANVNQLLAALQYTPATGYQGRDLLYISADDLSTPTPGTSWTVVTLLDSILPVPNVSAPDVQTVNEDATLKINPAISVSYPDANKELKVTLEASHGTLLAGCKGYLSSYTGYGTGILLMTGTQSAINYGLNGARYVPNHDYFGADQLTITYDPQDGSPPLQKTTTLHINSVNDPPALTVPSTTYSAVSGSPTAITGITASDPDIGSGAMAVDMRVLHGTVATSSYAASPHIVFSDTLGNVQAQLASLVYTSASSYVGPDFLTITVSDNGNAGAGGVLTDTRTYSINVS